MQGMQKYNNKCIVYSKILAYTKYSVASIFIENDGYRYYSPDHLVTLCKICPFPEVMAETKQGVTLVKYTDDK